MVSTSLLSTIRERLAAETGRVDKQAGEPVALCYPSPYRVAMSSLGFQQIYREIQATAGLCCERVFLPDEAEQPEVTTFAEPVSYETLRPIGDFRTLAFSVAYEIEIAGLVRMLHAASVPVQWRDRDERAPFVLAGGPLTFSNPLPLAPFCDAIIIGEGEGLTRFALETISGAPSKARAREMLSAQAHIFVPEHHGSQLPVTARCDDDLLPARSAIRTPHTELSDMFLIEAERGCSRGCQYCVMRRTTNGGMRIVDKERLLSLIPEEAKRVGLVGAAVSDHPRITDIVNALADRGATVGLSSLRPDRLKEPFVGALRRAGYRTLTTALDGPSQRLREQIERRGREPHYEEAARLVRWSGMDRLKLYLMIGLPGETDADIDECVEFVGKLSAISPVALGIAPFCAKRNTPLDGAPFAGIDIVRSRLQRLRRGLQGRADVRSTSAKWAWVEYVLAQGGEAEGLAMAQAALEGGTFAQYRAVFSAMGYGTDGGRPVAAQQGSATRLRLAVHS
jgi:radical SAM superfamily enzyme YgiQ (UPF0313 family)